MKLQRIYQHTKVINDYIRLAAVSALLGLTVGLAIVGLYSAYTFLQGLFSAVVGLNRYLVVVLPVLASPLHTIW